MKKQFSFTVVLACITFSMAAQPEYPVLSTVPVEVDYTTCLQEWDGFGFNYVETSQTRDYRKFPQDYGGFSLLSKKEKEEIIDLVFGEDGLRVGVVKMFLDPFHQKTPGGAFDHETTTSNMREFVKMGYQRTLQHGGDLEIITTLYGPPFWATLQKFLRGRDLDPEMKEELANYMVDWARYLIEEEGLPVKYISLHNEGEDWLRWPRDGKDGNIGNGHDYNMWWPSEQIVEFVNLVPEYIRKAGLKDVYVTPGECSNWFRFSHWGHAWALAENREAVENLGLITSHGFYTGDYNYWYGDHNPFGINLIKERRPDLHTWVTSSSWADMDVFFVRQIYGSIYGAGVNSFIPWAGIQRPPLWVGGDPNPGNAIQVSEEGDYEVRDGYYFYKQVSLPGQPGMKIAKTVVPNTDINVIAFAADDTDHPDAFVILNTRTNEGDGPNFSHEGDIRLTVNTKGTEATAFRAWRTDGQNDFYTYVGEFKLNKGTFDYTAPKGSVTTFIAVK